MKKEKKKLNTENQKVVLVDNEALSKVNGAGIEPKPKCFSNDPTTQQRCN